jgi:hypothetical protein
MLFAVLPQLGGADFVNVGFEDGNVSNLTP